MGQVVAPDQGGYVLGHCDVACSVGGDEVDELDRPAEGAVDAGLGGCGDGFDEEVIFCPEFEAGDLGAVG